MMNYGTERKMILEMREANRIRWAAEAAEREANRPAVTLMETVDAVLHRRKWAGRDPDPWRGEFEVRERGGDSWTPPGWNS
jgi:hypothetical protein